MRLSVIATCLSLCLIGFSAADDAHASETATMVDQTSAGSQVAGSNGTTKDSAQLEEVVVTAQKRQETVNNTPLAVTALGMTQLQDAGAYTRRPPPNLEGTPA